MDVISGDYTNFNPLKTTWFCYNTHFPQTPARVYSGLVFNGLIYKFLKMKCSKDTKMFCQKDTCTSSMQFIYNHVLAPFATKPKDIGFF